MAAGWSRISIFDPAGNKISEVDHPTSRSWVANKVGRCQFSVNVYDPFTGARNPECSLKNYQYGNLILVEHVPSTNADGSINGKLPDWVGIILPPQMWKYGEVTITAYSAEQILLYRPMPFNANVTGFCSDNFTQIIQYANSLGGLKIRPGNIAYGGPGDYRILALSALEEITPLVDHARMYWDVTPVLTPNNVLTLYANLYFRKGVDTGQLLTNVNLQSNAPIYTEQGTFFNKVFGYTDAMTDASRHAADAINQDSVSASGLLATNYVFSGTTKHDPQILANNFLKERSQPTKTIAPILLDVGNNFSYAVIGNTFNVQLDFVGFSGGGVGLQGQCKITAIEYSELNNVVSLAGAML